MALLAVPLLTAAWFWHSLVRNYFNQDDFKDLFLICNVPLLQYLVSPQGGHVYLFRDAVFYLAARLFGTAANEYFMLAWSTHLLNVALLFVAVENFSGSAWIACLAATLFGTCPVLEGSLGWFAVFGHVLAATGLLAVLADAARLVARGGALGRIRRWIWGALILASATSFGVSIGIAMVSPFALAMLLPASVRGQRRLPLWPLLGVLPATYVGSFWLYAHLAPGMPLSDTAVIAGWAGQRPFMLIAYMLGLTAYGVDRLLAGSIPIASFPAPAGLVVVGVASAFTLWALWYERPAVRRLLGTALLLTAACYGSVAFGRLPFFVVGGVVAILQVRYHYVGIATLALGVAAVAMALADALPRVAMWRKPLLAAFLCLWVGAIGVYPPAIDHHDRSRSDTLLAIAWMRYLAHQVPEGETVYIANRHFAAVSPIFFTLRDFPGWAGLFSIYFPDQDIDGRRVLFVEPDPSVRAAHRHARRLADALVAPEDVPLQPEFTPADPVCPVLGAPVGGPVATRTG